MSKDIRIIPRSENYSEWYNDVIKASELVEQSAVRGAMVFKPYGYAIWELIQRELDTRIKQSGHSNVYFPLLIPVSTLARESKHVAGFAVESAVVTHHRLKVENGELVVDPDAKLTEPFVIRPTSEAIMYETFGNWVNSWRDLPLLVNQWANVMRWEMRTRPFLRTSEFLWQEGHTAHATKEEAQEEQKWALHMYKEVSEDVLALSPLAGEKSPSERFAGADSTLTLEGYMQDGKALQSCTSHFLGQNFSKVFDISFTDKDEQKKYVWQTSWGMTTRIIGAVIMTHGDDKGIVLPPAIAPHQIVVLPVFKGDTHSILSEVNKIKDELQSQGLRVHVDTRDYLSFGERVFEWEKKGVPMRIEVGPRDIEHKSVTVTLRDIDEKTSVSRQELVAFTTQSLSDYHERLLKKSQYIREEGTREVSNWKEFVDTLEQKGGFILAYWDGSEETEARIKEETGATIRCIPFEESETEGLCVYSGSKATIKAVFAKAY